MNQREGNMTKTLFVVCFCYFLFVGPMILLEQVATIFHNFTNQTVYLSIFCLYWFQYSFNFIIYVIRAEQYRKAFIFFLSQVCFKNVAVQLVEKTIHKRKKSLLQIKICICGLNSTSSSTGHVQNIYTKNIFNIQTQGSNHVIHIVTRKKNMSV